MYNISGMSLEERVENLESRLKALEDTELQRHMGGKVSKKTHGKKKTIKKAVKKTRGKKKVNAYFTAMLKAKREGAKSFIYGGKTYVGREHDTLGMVYSHK